MATHFHTLQIKDVRQETADCISVSFDIPEELTKEFAFTSGQSIALRIWLDGEEIRRSYSICSTPFENELRVAIKKVPLGKFSNYAHEHFKAGVSIDVMPATGKFFTPLHKSHKKNYLFFAAGSGITPIISLIKSILQEEPYSRCTLIYGNRNRQSIIFREELESIKNKFIQRFALHHTLSAEKTDASIHYGRIDEAKCEALGKALVNFKLMDEVFICGPETMLFTVKKFLETNGIAKDNIHIELFNTPVASHNSIAGTTDNKANARQESKVTIVLDGSSFSFNLASHGDSVLDAALNAGADLPYSCKGGVCCSCRAKLVAGKVSMDVNYALEEDEIKAGFILTCQAHPQTQEVTINFDLS